MQERSENQILSHLLELDNTGQAERRVRLVDESYLSLINDPETGRGFVLRHGMDDTEGAEIPAGSEFYEYPSVQQAQLAFEKLLSESAAEGEVTEDDSTDDEGDFETSGAEIRDLYSDQDEDPLVHTGDLSEDGEEPPNTIDS